jgi:hypothetical protein
MGFIWLRIRTVAVSCEHGNEPSGSIKKGLLTAEHYELLNINLRLWSY